MSHAIFGAPNHELEVVHLRLQLPTARNSARGLLVATGETSTKRSALWSYQEQWEREEHNQGLNMIDTAHWLALSVLHARPATEEALRRCLTPGAGIDVPLPF